MEDKKLHFEVLTRSQKIKKRLLRVTIIIIIIITFILIQDKGFTGFTFKLEDIHWPKFCTTIFLICHYTDIGNGECQPRIGLFTPFKNKFQ